MRKLLYRVVRDLSLIPLTAFLVYQLVALLPIRLDSESKQESLASISRQLEDDMGLHQPLGFLRPWQKLVRGERLGDGSRAYTASDLSIALAGSLRIGAMALGLALLMASAYAFLRVLAQRTPLRHALEWFPVLVYATPSFILALLVATGTGISFDDDKRSFETIAAWVMAVGPGIFLGTILYDSLLAQTQKAYFLTALAKGHSRASALWTHALRNAFGAVLDALAPVATALLAGSFVVEKMFNISYFGLLYVDSAKEKQLGVVVIATTIFATLLIGVTLLADALKYALDPRTRE